MKKLAIIFSILILVFVLLIVGIPVVFKQPILEKTKATINKQVNAKVEFSDLSISVLKSFPQLSLILKDVIVSGYDEFQNDTLVHIPSAETNVALMSLFSKDGIVIHKIILDNPELTFKVTEDGKANWDITKAEEEPSQFVKVNYTGPETQEPAPEDEFVMQLEEVIINGAKVIYDDKSLGLFLGFVGSDFNISGNMYGSTTELNSNGDVKQFSMIYDSTEYVTNTSLRVKSIVSIDYKTMDILLGNNELWINNLPVDVSGSIKMPDENMLFDLKFNSKASGLNDMMALIPPAYADYLEGIETSGQASFSGFFKGSYQDEDYPEMDISLEINNGSFKYKSLPEEIKNIGGILKISKPQGVLDLLSVKLMNAHAQVKDNPVEMNFNVHNLLSDLLFDGSLSGTVNFSHLKDALPMDSIDILGTLDADISVNGTYSSIAAGEYNKITSRGSVILKNILINDPQLRQQIQIPSGKLGLSPQNINLSDFRMQIGGSDMELKGSVGNYLEYLFDKGDLQGNLQLNSKFLNLNELLTLQIPSEDASIAQAKADQKGADSDEPAEEEILVFDVPERMDLSFTSDVDKAIFDRLPITNIKGLVTVKDEKLNLNGLKMNMLDGELELTGSYKNNESNTPFFDFGFDVKDLNLPTAYKTLSGVRKIMPFAGTSTGTMSTRFNMKGRLSPALKVLAPTIDGLGNFSTKNLEIKDSPIFSQIKGILKEEKLQNVRIKDFIANFTVDKGNLLLKPFKTKIADQETTITGSLSATSLLNMKMDFVVQREAFGDDIQSILAVLPGQEKIKTVPATVNIKGSVGDPKVSLELEEARKQIMTEIKNSSADELKKSLDKLGKGLQKLFK